MSHPYNLLNPEVIANPYPVYQRLRASAPVYWHEELQSWLISHYSDLKELLRDPRFLFILIPPSPDQSETRSQIFELLSGMMAFSDLQNHLRLRSIVGKACETLFARMPERIQAIVDSLLDGVEGNGRMDMISDLTVPLELNVITDFIGVPLSDGKQFKQWIFHFAQFAQFAGYYPTTPEDDQKILLSLRDANDYFRALIAQRRQEPKEDLITALCTAQAQGEQLSDQEIIINTLLAAAASSPTPSMLGNSLLVLLRHPDAMQKLQYDPTLIGSAFEELLRYGTFFQWITRRANEDIELHGQLIKKDQIVLFGVGSANRDEAIFPDPERFDITRTDNRHLALGYGFHACLGGPPLIRQEGQIAINTVLRRLKGLRLETGTALEWVGGPQFQGLKSLPVTFS